MDHVVYLDYKDIELENLLNGSKSMIIRGAMGRKLPYGRVNEKDVLYFIENKGDGLIKAKAVVKNVFNSEKMEEKESIALVKKNQDKLKLDAGLKKRFAGKRYIVLIEVTNIKKLTPFTIDRTEYGNMDDWLPIENIANIKK